MNRIKAYMVDSKEQSCRNGINHEKDKPEQR